MLRPDPYTLHHLPTLSALPTLPTGRQATGRGVIKSAKER